MNIRKRKALNIFFICIFLAGISFNVCAEIQDDVEIIPVLRFWGADIGLNYKGISLIPSLTTRLCIWFGGGYETTGFYRDTDGIQYNPDDPDEEINLALYKKTELLWAIGIRQGIFFDPAKDDNLLEAHFFYRGVYNKNNDDTAYPETHIFLTEYPDAYGILLHTFVTGLFLDTSVVHETHRKRNGIKADISVELGPAFMNNTIGAADYTRVTVDLRGYVTLFDLDPEEKSEKNLFNLYICDRFLFDGLVGEYIPIIARQTVGGRNIKAYSGLGGIMRGINLRRFDGYLKMVNNFDIRMDLPGFWILVPGIVLYFDTGISDELNYYLSSENLHYSTGIGAFVYMFGFDVIVYANYWIDANKFSFTCDFALQF